MGLTKKSSQVLDVVGVGKGHQGAVGNEVVEAPARQLCRLLGSPLQRVVVDQVRLDYGDVAAVLELLGHALVDRGLVADEADDLVVLGPGNVLQECPLWMEVSVGDDWGWLVSRMWIGRTLTPIPLEAPVMT